MRFLIYLIILIPNFTWARVNIPRDLTSLDREKALKILGLGTTTKLLTDPYPLGGYAGFEVGLAVESLPISDISTLGAGTAEQETFSYPMISVGKGLYNNIDAFLTFMPFNEGTGLSAYGGFLRWGFLQMKYFPASFSLVAHANTSNINNEIINKTSGIDLIAGINVKDFALYVGLGQVQSNGEFIGGPNGVNAIENGVQINRTAIINSFHSVLGGTVKVDDFFIAMQIDQFEQTTLSLKLGYRN